MSKWKTVCWRYGQRTVTEHTDKDEAYREGKIGADLGNHFFECLLDENDVIVYDGRKSVIGMKGDRKGQVYNWEGTR